MHHSSKLRLAQLFVNSGANDETMTDAGARLLAIQETYCDETQLTLLNGNKERLPVLANTKLDEQGNIYWSIFSAVKRDKLYSDLINARTQLEAQTDALKILSSTDELTGLLNRR